MHVTKLVTYFLLLSVEIHKVKGPGDDDKEKRNAGIVFTLLLNLNLFCYV
jgi:hypothetical protein